MGRHVGATVDMSRYEMKGGIGVAGHVCTIMAVYMQIFIREL